MDNVDGLEKWKEAPEILAPGLCKLVIAPRYQAMMTADAIQAHLPNRVKDVDWFLLKSPDSDVSSTLVREWIASEVDAPCADYLVPNAVRKIIAKYKLYRRTKSA
jgi:nicotinic acid mononucleotide adenylyltransferase